MSLNTHTTGPLCSTQLKDFLHVFKRERFLFHRLTFHPKTLEKAERGALKKKLEGQGSNQSGHE